MQPRDVEGLQGAAEGRLGDPEERFREDYLRMLRAVRFSTQLGFAIEPRTYAAIRRNAASIVRISGERIALELEGTLVQKRKRCRFVISVDLLSQSIATEVYREEVEAA